MGDPVVQQKSDIEAAVAAAKAFGEVQVIEIEGIEGSERVLSVPEGREIQSIKPLLDEYALEPDRKKGTADLARMSSFIDHAKRFKIDDSAIFADIANRASPKLVSVLNYHGPAEGAQRFGDHCGVYSFPMSKEWGAWSKKFEPMDQGAFAEFLEERILDIMEPADVGEATRLLAGRLGITLAPPQRMMELSKGLTVRVDQTVTGAVNLSSGEARIGYQETHAGEGGPLSVPSGFAIAIPVFANEDMFTLIVRLRYRVVSNKVKWFFAIQQIDKAWETAIDEACAKVQKETGLPLFFGTPENPR